MLFAFILPRFPSGWFWRSLVYIRRWSLRLGWGRVLGYPLCPTPPSRSLRQGRKWVSFSLHFLSWFWYLRMISTFLFSIWLNIRTHFPSILLWRVFFFLFQITSPGSKNRYNKQKLVNDQNYKLEQRKLTNRQTNKICTHRPVTDLSFNWVAIKCLNYSFKICRLY